MENIIKLLKTYLTDIKDEESLLLYQELIISHPHYKIIRNLPILPNYATVSDIISFGPLNVSINPEHESFKNWFDCVKNQYNKIINGKYN